jgi:hypothetical protein
MEPVKNAMMDVFLGLFPVEEVSMDNKMAINIGNNVRIICHLHAGFPHLVKSGDLVPLYTKVPYNAAAIKPLLQ